MAAIAARQRNRASRRQLLAAGLSSDQIHHLVRTDRLFAELAGVYAVGSPAPVHLGRETAALLAVSDGAPLSHQTGAGRCTRSSPRPTFRARRQARLGGYRVDADWPDAGLVVEVDGFGVHSRRRRCESDRIRDARLDALGIHVHRVTWRQMTREPLAMIARIAGAYARRTSTPA